MNDDLRTYYKNRAREYENVYLKPERQDDLKKATIVLQDTFENKHILEICCGTGYWTQIISKSAASVFATDINESVLEIARRKNYINANVTLGIADFYTYPDTNRYDGLFGGFIWSHIQLQDLKTFVVKANKFVVPGGRVVFMDNNYVEGNSHAITNVDGHGNTFQTRKLEDGTRHLVCKNFPSEAFILEQIKGIADDVQFVNLKYFWILVYRPLDI